MQCAGLMKISTKVEKEAIGRDEKLKIPILPPLNFHFPPKLGFSLAKRGKGAWFVKVRGKCGRDLGEFSPNGKACWRRLCVSVWVCFPCPCMG